MFIFSQLQKNDTIMVSPGVILPLEDFRASLKNTSYQLPLYPSSFILATDIQITVNVPFPSHTLPTLLRMSYDHNIHGGFGPFTFGPLYQGRLHVRGLKFRVETRSDRIVITFPGTQLIGYICDIVPQHPPETQSGGKRRRRSTGKGKRDVISSSSKFGQWLSSKTGRTYGTSGRTEAWKSAFQLQERATQQYNPVYSENEYHNVLAVYSNISQQH